MIYSAMLYLVATPIGNLADITLRALETLKSVDLVVSEDTRKTGMLLKHFGISARQMPFHEHNEAVILPRILALLREGKSIALVSNAGTPGISDPGFTLVRSAVEADLPLTMIPGPTAFVMAVVLSGLPVHSFTFRGFPPRRPGPRRRFLAVDRDSPHTLVFYESPYRLVAMLEDCLAVFGDRRCAIANDLTKRFESVQRGLLSEMIARLAGSKLLGEYTVVIAGAQTARSEPTTVEDGDAGSRDDVDAN